MNQFILVGKVEKKPTFKKKEGKASLTFVIDSKRDYKNENGEYVSDRYQIVTLDNLAENLQEVLQEGSIVGVKGRIVSNNKVNKSGTRYSASLVGERVSVLEKQ